jgi:hypothetical protein
MQSYSKNVRRNHHKSNYKLDIPRLGRTPGRRSVGRVALDFPAEKAAAECYYILSLLAYFSVRGAEPFFVNFE